MISKELLETMTQAQMDSLRKQGATNRSYATSGEDTRRIYRKSMGDALEAVGVKVEGSEQRKQESDDADEF